MAKGAARAGLWRFLGRLFGRARRGSAAPSPPPGDDAPPVADAAAALAGRLLAIPVEGRLLLARDPAAPAELDLLLAADAEADVRAELALRIGRLVPDLGADGREELRARVADVLERLARDQLPRVRRLVAEAIRDSGAVPEHLVRLLAADAELNVAGPILEYSPLLSDHDLLEILATTRIEGAAAAIARRRVLNEPVADAIVARFEVPAVAALLGNPGARLGPEAVDEIVDRLARDLDNALEDLHAPLVLRPELSVRAATRLAGMVAASLVDDLVARHGIDPEAARRLHAEVRQSLADARTEDAEARAHAEAEAARTAFFDGRLDEAALVDAVERGRRDFAIAALALRARLPRQTVSRILDTRVGKPIVALSWKAGLSMRTAGRLQAVIGRVPHGHRVRARDGIRYPLDEREMRWLLDYFTD